VHDLEAAAVELAAQHRALVRVGQRPAVLGGDVQPAVADREVEPAVGADDQPVQVVADQRRVYAEAVEHGLPDLGGAVAVLVAQPPELGDVGVPDVAAVRQHARADALLGGGSFGYRVLSRLDNGIFGLAIRRVLPDGSERVSLAAVEIVQRPMILNGRMSL